MTNVRTLPYVVDPAKPLEFQPLPEVVEKLEEMLELARAGRLRAVGIAAVMYDEAGDSVPTHCYTSSGSGSLLVAAASYLHHRLVTYMLDDHVHVEMPSPPESA